MVHTFKYFLSKKNSQRHEHCRKSNALNVTIKTLEMKNRVKLSISRVVWVKVFDKNNWLKNALNMKIINLLFGATKF